MVYFIIICAAIGAISVITFCFYGADKRAAIKGRWRVSERVLLSLSFFGGAIGGILGMLVAIPCYTVLRVIAARFFQNVKFIRELTSDGGKDGTSQKTR